jgi:hypothetical protein
MDQETLELEPRWNSMTDTIFETFWNSLTRSIFSMSINWYFVLIDGQFWFLHSRCPRDSTAWEFSNRLRARLTEIFNDCRFLGPAAQIFEMRTLFLGPPSHEFPWGCRRRGQRTFTVNFGFRCQTIPELASR